MSYATEVKGIKINNLYFVYGKLLGILGFLGFMITGAKSALISGLASAFIIIVLSGLYYKNQTLKITTQSLNAILLGVFSWRTSIAASAYFAGAQEKLVPFIFLACMALVSITALVLSFTFKEEA